MSKVITRITSILVSTLIAFSSLGFGAVIDDLSTAMLVSHAQDTSGSSTDGKYGSSEGFNNLQDTKIVDGIKYYNTNYGLHTDKTVSNYAPDGRTFDLDLESWYVGENPADVGMVLDASGSMAWTTNTLEPLVLNPKMIDLEELKNSQKENGGYLTEEQVEKILKPENTDSSKILYDNYSYYVYESRPSVSEFVPLGFWEGSISRPASSIGDLIGYYPFDGTLENKAKVNASGKLIEHAEDGESFSDTELTISETIQFDKGGLDLSETDKKGNIVIDLSNKLNVNEKITISFDLYCESIEGGLVPQSPIFYLGDGSTSNYLAIQRGRSHTGTGASKNLYLFNNGSKIIHEGSTTADNKILDKKYERWLTDCKLEISNEGTDYSAVLSVDGSSFTYKVNIDLTSDKLYFILGGDELLPKGELSYEGSQIDPTNLKGNYIRDLSINGTTSTDEPFLANFSLEDESGLTDTVNNISASLKKQLTGTETEFDTVNSPDLLPAKPVFTDTEYKGSKALNVTQTSKLGGVLLDAKPISNNYTISFAIRQNPKEESSGKTNDEKSNANIMYLGSLDQQDYYQICKAGSSSDPRRLRMREKNSTSDKSSISVFSKDDYSYITYVVDDMNVKSYLNGTVETDSSSDVLTGSFDTAHNDINIILAGLADKYGSGDILLDELYVYDEALSDVNVKKLYEIVSGNNDETKAYDSKGNVIATFTADLAKSSDQNERRGWYYVNSGSGWDNVSDPDVATAKSFEGIKYESKMDSSDHIYNHANIPSAYNDSEYEELKDSIKNADNDFEFKNLNKDKEMHIRFYIDDSNMLRCFFNSGGNTSDSAFSKNSKENGNDPECRTQCSVVYYKPDKEPIKAESLNTVLNNFRNQLQNFSEKSKLSAVRFSTDEVVVDGEDKERADYDENLKTLMLLNWVSKNDDNNEYSTNLADIRRGFDDSSTSTVDNLYNYYLTGGTNTWIGLKSFYDNLNTPEIQGDGNNKYLIIFTDGRDTLNGSTSKAFSGITDFLPEGVTVEDDSQMASAWANKLKNDGGYKIFCVMLSTGSVSETANPDEYDAAKTFLQGLASDKEYVYDPTDEDELQAAFDEILSQIAVPLSNYTVQDYIDPRFDLVTYTDDEERGTVLHLGAGGNITDEDNNHLAKVGNAIKESGATFYEYTTKDGKTANIYYDDSNDMYYLRWTDQNIPGSTAPIDTDEDEGYIDVWSSTITVRAKQDFIGGNEVLTNGNDAGMNLVFSPQSLSDGKMLSDLSGSGTATSTDKGSGNSDNSYASKGFPRTTVNVRLLDVETNNFNDVIYLGEVVSPTQMLVDLEDDYMTDSYYLEYLSRYAYRIYGDSDIGKDGSSGKPLIDLLNKWLKINDKSFEKKSFTIPYMYLPDAQYDDDGKLIRDGDKVIVHNNSGTETNQKDILGILTYEWERTDPNFKEEDGKDITDDFVVNATDQIVYQLSMKFTPLKEDDISLQDDSYVFITKKDEDTTYLNRSDLFFDIVDGEFTEAKENDAHDAGWTFYNRSEYNGALVVDENYEWDNEYKATQGYEQIESYQDYGDGQITDEGFSLSAETIYTKDVVNAGLALELLVKGSDLTGGNITEGKTYTFTATRKYDDPFDPDPYGDTLGADRIVDGEQYQLTFTIDKSTIPGSIDNDTYYSIWAKLTGVKKGDEELSTKGLPIGTYTLALDDLNDEDLTVKDDVQFKILTAESPSNPEKFEAKLFPEDVTNKSNSNPDYNIADDTKAKQNVAEVGKSSNTATFYFGTTKDGINKGNRENPASDYVKDRLGIIVLTYGDNSLSISKEVTNTDDSTNLEREWEFLVTLTKTVGAGDEGDILTYNAKKTDKDGNVIGDTTTVTFTESGTESGIYTAEIKLKSGEKLTILQLPSGYQYTVQEIIDPSDSWKYTPYIGTTDNRTNVSADELLTPASSVHFINQFNTAELPSAGGSGTSWYIISGSVLMFIGLATLFIAQRKMRRQKV